MNILLPACLLFALAAEAVEAPAVKEPALRAELLLRVKVDQDARTALISWGKDFGTKGAVENTPLSAEDKVAGDKLKAAAKAADEANTAWLKTIVDRHGWPTIRLVGKDGASAAWLLVQHADADVKFQRRCLDLMTRLPSEEISLTNIAYLTDRVLLAEGKKQLYGTQFTSIDGQWKPRPLEDEANVDKRRATVGLQPLAEYVKEIEKLYGKPMQE